MDRMTVLAVVHRAKPDLVAKAPDPLAVGDYGGELPAQTSGGALTPHAERLLDDGGRGLAGGRSSVRRQLLTQVGSVVEPARERRNQPVSGRYRAVGDLIILGHAQCHRTVLLHLLAVAAMRSGIQHLADVLRLSRSRPAESCCEGSHPPSV